MNLIARIRRLPTLAIIIILIVAIYFGIKAVKFLSVLFVYLGWNVFGYLENMLIIPAVKPLIMWGILGVLIGSIFGVTIAIKKYKLPKKLVLYPIGIAILFFLIFSLFNKPFNLTGSINPMIDSNNNANNAIPNENVNLVYYTVTQDMNVRIKPSLQSSILFTLHRNSKVQIINSVKDQNNTLWSKIEYTNNSGYKQSGYLKNKYLRN